MFKQMNKPLKLRKVKKYKIPISKKINKLLKLHKIKKLI